MGRRKKKESPFRSILCSFMEQSNLSVRQTAMIAEVPPSTLANWRAGATPDDHLALHRLALHFGVTLGYLLTGEDDRSDISMSHPPSKSKILVFEAARITIEISESDKPQQPLLGMQQVCVDD